MQSVYPVWKTGLHTPRRKVFYMWFFFKKNKISREQTPELIGKNHN